MKAVKSSAVETGAIELDAEALSVATDGFAEGRVVGTGGFGKVFLVQKKKKRDRDSGSNIDFGR